MSGSPYSVNNFNTSFSRISDIWIFKDGDSLENGIRVLVRDEKNPHCQFEKLEMIESVFETFPKGSLTVRDTSDIITVISNAGYNSIYIQFIEESDPQYIIGDITSTSYINNAASELESTFVTINFTNHLYKFNQQNSLTNVINLSKPVVNKLEDFLKTGSENQPLNSIRLDVKIYSNITNPENLAYSRLDGEVLYPVFDNIDFTENFILYRPLNPIEDRTEVPSEDIFKYVNYLTSYVIPQSGIVNHPQSSSAISYDSKSPRFLFWTSWNNRMNLKYFYNRPENDTIKNKKLTDNNLRFAVYDSDSPTLTDDTTGFVYNKVKILTTGPADQFMSTKYFYIRKTPRLLTSYRGNTYSYGNTYMNLAFQFQDDGEKYLFETVTSDGITGSVIPGANLMIDKGFWGHYDSLNSSNEVGKHSLIGNDFGYAQQYFGNTFMGISFAMPYVDCPEMWKNQFDLTPIHPNLNLPITQLPGQPVDNRSFLQKIIDLRYDTFVETKGIPRQLQKIREIERQNFIYYVLCCIGQTTEDDETFFARITGCKPEESPYAENGINGEPLKYLYEWKKLEFINTGSNPTVIEGKFFRGLENSDFWTMSPTVGSDPDDNTTLAINLNERTNEYNPDLPSFSYYAPGWYAQNLIGGNNVKYRPIGNDIGPLETIPPFDSVIQIGHIVRMTKTPFSKILKESGFTYAPLYEQFSNKYLYTFNAGNITDGPCPSI